MFFWPVFIVAAIIGLVCGLVLTLTIVKTISVIATCIAVGALGLGLVIWKLSDGGQGSVAAGIIMLLMNVVITAFVFAIVLGFGAFLSIVF